MRALRDVVIVADHTSSHSSGQRVLSSYLPPSEHTVSLLFVSYFMLSVANSVTQMHKPTRNKSSDFLNVKLWSMACLIRLPPAHNFTHI
jgi:hypothetical protein